MTHFGCRLLFIVTLVALLAPVALATPIVDGRVTGADGYADIWYDALNEPGLSGGGLDIHSVLVSQDNQWRTFNLRVAAEPIQPFGSVDGFGDTAISLEFRQDATSPLLYRFVVTLGSELSVTMRYNDSGTWKSQSLPIGGSCLLAVADGVELSLRSDWMTNLVGDSFHMRILLDDNGPSADDQLAILVPEPLTLVSLLAGWGVVLRRRRR